MRRLALTTGSILLVAGLAVPQIAFSHQPSAGPTRVAASLTYGGKAPHTTQRLEITSGGHQLFNQRVRSRFCAGCAPVGLGTSSSPLRVLDLESDRQPDVVLGLYTGAAHCCYIDQVYSLDLGTMTYVRSEHDFLDASPAIKLLAGHYAFVSADERFAYAFSDFAHSGAPLQIWSFNARRFQDVTGRFPVRLKADAARWLRRFHRDLGNGEGFISAWAADEYRLGNFGLVGSTLATELHRGDLRSTAGSRVPTGERFVSSLRKLLHKLGYAARKQS